jgi:hypothetical protein
MSENFDQNRDDVFKRANAYLHEVPDLDSDEAVKRYLASAGIDASKARENAMALVKRVLGRRRMEQARQKRDGKLQVLDRIKTRAFSLGEPAGRRLLSLAESGDLNGAMLLARKFEESCPEDVASLEEDLALLDELGKDDGPDAGK